MLKNALPERVPWGTGPWPVKPTSSRHAHSSSGIQQALCRSLTGNLIRS